MAVKLITVHVSESLDDAEKDRRFETFQRRLNDFAAFTDDKGWQSNASIFNVGSTLVASFQLFHTPQHQVKESTLETELAKWEADRPAREAKAKSGILRT